jgi:hypothetical protein
MPDPNSPSQHPVTRWTLPEKYRFNQLLRRLLAKAPRPNLLSTLDYRITG